MHFRISINTGSLRYSHCWCACMMAAGGLVSTVRRVISEEMSKEGVLQKDVPEDPHITPSDVQQVKNSVGRRYYRCKAFAHFDEHVDKPDQSEQHGRRCKHTWKSAHAWCVLDLKKQRIAHRWYQECKKCEGESKPWFDEAALKRMAEYAVKRFKGVKAEKKENGNPPEMGPHDERRCDMCRQLGHSCWKKPTYSCAADDQDEDDEYGNPYDDDGTHDDDYDPYDYNDTHNDDYDPYDYDDTHNDVYDPYVYDYGDTYDDEYDQYEHGHGDEDLYNFD